MSTIPTTSIPAIPGLTDYWVTPGGGLESGETHEDAAHRELREETGFGVQVLDGPIVRRRYDLVIRGCLTRCVEHLYVGKVDAIRPVVDISGQLPDELKTLRDIRWWTRNELGTTEARVLPVGLAGVVDQWLDGSLALTPIETT